MNFLLYFACDVQFLAMHFLANWNDILYCVSFRYSTMLAENLVDNYKPVQQHPVQGQPSNKYKEVEEDDTSESSEQNAGK